MPKYKYKAIETASGKAVSGVTDAESESILYGRLKTQGLSMTECAEQSDQKKRRRLPMPVIADFCSELSSMLKSGIALVRALNIICGEDTVKPAHRAVYTDVVDQICEGTAFSDAMENQGEAFPELLVNMIRAAEASGTLDETLNRMGRYYERQNKLNKKISSSTTYPKLLSVILIIAVFFVVGVIVPQFDSVFAMMDELPAITQFMLDLSEIIKNYWYMLIGGIVALVIIIRIVLRIPAVRITVDHFKLKVPLIGKLLRTIYTSRFANTLSSLYSGGIPITTSLAVGRHTIGNLYIDMQFDAVIDRLRAGESLSGAIGEVDGFDRKLASVIMVGEESGNLDDMLNNISDRMNYESEAAIERMVTLIEPALIIVMALVIGVIMVAVMLPIIQLYSSIEQSSYM